MSLFYNPYSKTSILPPMADIQNMLMMYWMMKNLGGKQTTEKTSTAPQPSYPTQIQGGTPTGMQNILTQQAPGIDPAILMQLLPFLTGGYGR